MTIAGTERALEEWAAPWSTLDVDRLLSVFVEDCLYEDVALGAVNKGKDKLRAFAAGAFGAFPDFQIELTSRFTTSDWGGAEWTMSGTHRGDLPGLPATGRGFEVRGSTIVEFAGDKITRCTDYWDMAAFLRQTGATPSE